MSKFFNKVDNFLFNAAQMLHRPASSYCRLETAEGPHTLIADDASMISIVELHGLLKMAGQQELNDLIERAVTALNPRMARPGHVMHVTMEYDPSQAAHEVHQALLPSRVTARKIGLAAEGMMDDWEQSVARYCANEKVFIALWTRPFILTAAELNDAKRQLAKTIAEGTYGAGMQQVGKILTPIRDSHQGWVSAVSGAFQNAGMKVRLLENHEALWWIRHSVDPEFTGRKWRARLPGDPPTLHLPEPTETESVMSMFYPDLKRQLWPRPAMDLNHRHVLVGDRIHAPLLMSMPPQTPEVFQELFRELRNKGIPWRASFMIDPDGLKAMTWKSVFASILSITSSVNLKFCAAMDELQARALQDECIVRFRASFDTWVAAPGDINDPGALNHALAELSHRCSKMAAAVQSWGSCDVQETVGDPLLGFSSTLPAMMAKHPAPAAAAPLADIVRMLPITRPASPWLDGSVLLRSPDGKIWPYAQGSSKQAAWITIGFAPMGAGKSVWLNTCNQGFLLSPGLTRLPWLSIIDIGPSSRGLISLMQALLPPHLRHLAIYKRLRMERDYAINPFDTPLGCRKPLPAQRDFLVNLLSLFATPLDASAPQDGVPGIAREAVDACYDDLAPERSPKLYTSGVDLEVDEALSCLSDMEIDEATSWWEVVDALYAAGMTRQASLAQRYAVPLLAEVAAMARRDKIAAIYKHCTPGGEPITDFFWRSCLEAISAYPILKEPTRFDLGEAQIISLDLDEVAPKGGPAAQRQSGVMFMLARQIVAGRFFQMPEDVKLIPEMYQAYHEQRIDQIRQDPKKLCVDEFHRASKGGGPVVEQFMSDIKTAVRESRKWNLMLDFYSQTESDFPDELVELATSIFILGAGSHDEINRLVRKFGLNEASRYAISRLTKPGASGSSMVGLFRTDEGDVLHRLTSTIGQQMLWAFSSTTEDAKVRNALYGILGVEATLKVLAENYPGGIKAEVERRRLQATDESGDVLQDLIVELTEKGQKYQHAA